MKWGNTQNHLLFPRFYYLRTHNDLEIDLIIEVENMSIYPIEIKLTKTPKMGMAQNISRFTKLFTKLDIKDGKIISLTDKNIKLSKEVYIQKLEDYFSWLQNI